MKIAIFYSGCVRTLKYTIKNTIDTIKKNIGDCEIFTFYSFWDMTDKPTDIPDNFCISISEKGFDRHYFGGKNEYESNCKFFPIEPQEIIEKYILDSGSNFVNGDIEPFDVSKEIISKSPYINIPKLISQYYKIYRVAKLCSVMEYDLCLRIRPDVTINNFPTRNEIINMNKTLFMNKFLWPGGISDLYSCNEMVWASTSDIFLETCSLYLLNEVLNTNPCGENVTANYFRKLIDKKIVHNYSFFDFNHITFKYEK